MCTGPKAANVLKDQTDVVQGIQRWMCQLCCAHSICVANQQRSQIHSSKLLELQLRLCLGIYRFQFCVGAMEHADASAMPR